MPKPKKPSVADQFSDEEMQQIQHMGQMLHGGVTPFDEAVEEALNKREAGEASAKKMRSAQTGSDDASLGPTQIEQQAVKQRTSVNQQADVEGTEQAAQAQGPQAVSPLAPAPPKGSVVPSQGPEGSPEAAGPPKKPAAQAPPPAVAPPAPSGPPQDEEESQP